MSQFGEAFDASSPFDLQDEEALANLRREFIEISDLVETDFVNATPQKRVNLYATIFNAATRPKLADPKHYYQVQGHLYVFCESIVTQYMLRRPININELPEKMYASVTKKWRHFKVIVKWIEKTFSYLSRYYIPYCEVKPLDQLAMSIFYKELFQYVVVPARMVILSLLRREKNGETIEPQEIQLGTEIFIRISQSVSPKLYKEELATYVIDAAVEGYKKDAIVWLATDSATMYMELAEKALQEEQRRCARYFLRSTEAELMQRVEHELLAVHKDALLHKEQSGFVSLLRDMRTDHLRRAFLLFSRIPKGVETLGALLREQCSIEVSDIVKRHWTDVPSDVNYQAYVSDFLELHERYKNLVFHQFDSHPILMKAMRMAIESGLGQSIGGVPSSELIAAYCDTVIRGRGCSIRVGEAEVDDHFDRIVAVLGYISDKDVFQSHARQNLAIRLLQTSANEEIEKLLILKLKSKCGASFTSHFEGMLKDKAAAVELQQDFMTWMETKKIPKPFEFSVLVLTYGFWPRFSIDNEILPFPVQAMMDHFTKYYLSQKTQHRVLSWPNSHATAVLIGRFREGRVHEFQVNAFQACVLLIFNERDVITPMQVVEMLRIPFDELKKVFPSFTRIKLIMRRGGTATLKETDEFIYNPDFISLSRKLKIPPAYPKIASQQSAVVHMRADEDRKPAIDACLVRIMKSRKQLDHSTLLTECIHQLSNAFHPDPRLIKVRIEDLINREFLERIPDTQPSCYRYVA